MLKRQWILGLAVLALLVCGKANAASVHQFHGGVTLVGEITVGDFNKVKRALNRVRKKTLFLNSAGGLVSEALLIGNWLRDSGFETRLDRNSRCASACVLIFAGGIIRTAHPSSTIIVHMGSGLFNEDVINDFKNVYEEYGPAGSAILASIAEQRAALITLKQVNFLLKSGVSINFLDIASSVHHLDGKELTRSQALKLNLINAD